VRDDSGRHRPQARLREELDSLLRRFRPHLLDANSLSMGRLSGPVAAASGLPSVAHLRDILGLSRQATRDLNLHRRLLAVSAATRQFHLRGGLRPDQVEVLHNGVDLEEFCPRRPTGYLHRELGLPPGVPLVGTIGQIGLRKGQDVLIEAAQTLHRAVPEVHYVIAGARFSQKAEARRFEARLRAAGQGKLQGRLHLIGYRHDVARLLAEFTLLVHPARQEPLGRVLLEAAATGRAVVATDVGGTREIFPPGGKAAWLVPPNDPHRLARAVQQLLADEPLRRRLGRAARHRAEQAFDARQAARALVGHYQAVLAADQ